MHSLEYLICICNVHAAAEMFLSIQHCQLLKISIYCKLNFNFTDTFEEALRLEKRAVETSNLEDDYHEQNPETCRQVLKKNIQSSRMQSRKILEKTKEKSQGYNANQLVDILGYK